MGTRPSPTRVAGSKWFVRVDGTESFLRSKCLEAARWIDTDTLLATYHVGAKKENPHAHIICEMSSILQKQSFDVRIKNLFEIVKGTSYSTKLWDGAYGEGAGSYLFHEEQIIIDASGNETCGDTVLACKGFTELHLDTFRTANRSVQKMIKINKEKASNKLVDKALEQFMGCAYTNQTKFDIYFFMLESIRKLENYHPGEFALKKYVQEVDLRCQPDSLFEQFARQSYMKLFYEH